MGNLLELRKAIDSNPEIFEEIKKLTKKKIEPVSDVIEAMTDEKKEDFVAIATVTTTATGTLSDFVKKL